MVVQPSQRHLHKPSIYNLDISSNHLDGNEDYSQPTANNLRFQRSGWLKRAKAVALINSAGDVENQDQVEIRRVDSLSHIVAGADSNKGVSDEHGKVDTRGDYNTQSKETKTYIGTNEEDSLLVMRSDPAANMSKKLKSTVCHSEQPSRTQQRRSQRNSTSPSPGAHPNDPTRKNFSALENNTVPQKAFGVMQHLTQYRHAASQEDILGNDNLTSQQRYPLRHVAPPSIPSVVAFSSYYSLERSASCELGSQYQVQSVSRLRDIRGSTITNTRDNPKHATIMNGGICPNTTMSNHLLIHHPPDLTFTTQASPPQTHTYFTHPTAQLSSPTTSCNSPPKEIRRKSRFPAGVYGAGSWSTGKVRKCGLGGSQGSLELGVTPRLKRRMSRVPFVPPFKRE